MLNKGTAIENFAWLYIIFATMIFFSMVALASFLNNVV